jgi:DNA-binding NarL/FixJ family response regulator
MPGIAEQSLRVTLKSLPAVKVVGSATGCLSALQLVREKQAEMVVIDSNLPFEDVRIFLRQLRSEGLPTRALVLAATHGQVRNALAAGADAALRRDVSIRRLEEVVDRLQRTHPGQAPDESG